MANKGLFVVLEGIDNCGKTTQLKLLKKYFENNGKKVLVVREPGGTKVGEEIRKVLLKNRPKMMDPITQTMLFYASRREFLKEIVIPNVENGLVVLSDRFEASTYVYQGIVQGVKKSFINSLSDEIVGSLKSKPDLYIILDITIEESLKRDSNKNNKGQQLIYEKQGTEFREKLRNGYKKYVKESGTENIFLLNGMKEEMVVHEMIVNLVEQKI